MGQLLALLHPCPQHLPALPEPGNVTSIKAHLFLRKSIWPVTCFVKIKDGKAFVHGALSDCKKLRPQSRLSTDDFDLHCSVLHQDGLILYRMLTQCCSPSRITEQCECEGEEMTCARCNGKTKMVTPAVSKVFCFWKNYATAKSMLKRTFFFLRSKLARRSLAIARCTNSLMEF